MNATVQVTTKLRKVFDETVEQVLCGLPQQARDALTRIPLIVEDDVGADAEELGVGNGQLLGLYTGVPITVRSIEHVGEPSEVIRIYRAGILAVALDQHGHLDVTRLCEEIRTTVLHEIGHHFGFSDERLSNHGY